ncbi:hypothetical protein LPJ78_001719 [Coemansia sp. RSA 989]|nr:hypothetical protein LPJ78_001719 [Coemansia sp. RSA 989]
MVDTAAAAEAPREQSAEQTGKLDKHRWRGRDVVFVDPLDTTVPYWWPAMIVPTDEIDTTMGCLQLEADEYLVKYFEDCKYSTVRGSELRKFDTSQNPFKEFAATSTAFSKDKGVRGALSFLKTGHVQPKFQWRLWQTGSETLQLPFTLPAADPRASAFVDSDNTLVKDSNSPISPADDGDDEAGSPDSQPSEKSDLTLSKPSPPLNPASAAVAENAAASPARSRRVTRLQNPAGGAPRRGRPPRQQSAGGSAGRSRKRRASEVRDTREESPASTASDSMPPRILEAVRELEEVQEEYRIFRSLVRRAAKDLWLEMGNEWPPNLGASTRFAREKEQAKEVQEIEARLRASANSASHLVDSWLSDDESDHEPAKPRQTIAAFGALLAMAIAGEHYEAHPVAPAHEEHPAAGYQAHPPAPVGNLPEHEEHPAGPGYGAGPAPVGNLPAHEEHPAGYQAHPAPVGNLPEHVEHPAGPAYGAGPAPVGNLPAHEEHPAGPGYGAGPAPVGNLPAHEEHPAGPGYAGPGHEAAPRGYEAHPAPVGNLPAHEEHPAGPGYAIAPAPVYVAPVYVPQPAPIVAPAHEGGYQAHPAPVGNLPEHVEHPVGYEEHPVAPAHEEHPAGYQAHPAPVGNLPAHEEHPAGPGYGAGPGPVGNLPEHEEHPAGPGYQAKPAPIAAPAHEEHPAAPGYHAEAPHY